METKIPSSGTDYALDIDLAYPIDSTRTTFNVTGSNVISHRLHDSKDFRLLTCNLLQIEIKLHKRQAVQWSSLDAKSVVGKTQPPGELLSDEKIRMKDDRSFSRDESSH